MCYETFCYSLTSEMDQYFKYSDSSKKVRKMYKIISLTGVKN